MRAADVMETPPSVRLDAAFLPVLRMVSQHGWPGSVVVEIAKRVPVARPQATVVEDGDTLGVVSANRLLGVVAAATEDRSR
ncbi:hypothetical protein [Micromonospora sp. CPCC 206061]|uniref:hypothetical protein n=1 Tax=Micromonospora sp. CPCC 206061 TaxID=3122410 RepID=UPI002FF0A07C